MNAIIRGAIAHLVALGLVTISLPCQSPALATPPDQGKVAGQTLAKRFDLTNAAGLHRADASRLVGGGKHFQAYFSRQGLMFHPILGMAAPTLQHVALTPQSIARGAASVAVGSEVMPCFRGLQVQYHHVDSMTERYDVHPHGIELSWRFDERPPGDGDLAVHYAVDTTLADVQQTADGGVELWLPGVGGVSLGGVTGIDANGTRVAGTLRYAQGELELSLPAAFVDSAVYPVVLDPLIGTVFNVMLTTQIDGDPDVAYDATNDRYLVVFMRALAANTVVPRGQMITSAGVGINNTIFFTAQGVCDRVRVANLASHDRFGVVWCSNQFGLGSLMFQACDPVASNLSHLAVLASTTAVTPYKHADIGGVGDEAMQIGRGFMVVYEDDIQNAIRARRVYFDAGDNLVAPTAFNVYSDQGGIGSTYREPEISRTSGDTDKFLVAVRRNSGVGPSVRTAVAVLDAALSVVGSKSSFGGLVNGSVSQPDVDGVNGHWVVAWQQTASGTAAQVVARATVDLSSTGTLMLGTPATLGGGIQSAQSPTLGYAAGRTWLGYRWNTSFSSSLRALAIDSASVTAGGDSFSEPIPTASTGGRIVVGTMASGGDVTGEGSLLVFEEGDSIFGQLLQHYGTSGSLISIGGACGAGGTQAFNHSPGIGSSYMACNLSGLSPSALLSVFNLAPLANSVSCGLCDLVPYGVTAVRVVSQQEANFAFAIPCLPSLVGSSMLTQWTTFDVTQTPCSLAPNFALSDRVLWTFGQ
tara:strand:- start:4898 stop:7162 length:2265 start_codon:yes stop_codon:yes gene_type:complete